MKRATFTATIALLLIAGAAHAALQGGWTVARHKGEPGTIHLNLTREHNDLGQNIEVADLTGLTAAQIASATSTPVSFSLQREAGTIRLEGTFRNGAGGGQFEFAPNLAYLATLRDLGVPLASDKRHGHGDQSPEEQLLSLAVLDVSTGFIRSMRAAGYDEPLDTYLAMRIFDVTPELVADFRALGMRLSADNLVAGRIHGVSPDYVERMRELHGKNLSFDDLVATRIHGATPEFIAEMRDLGYGELDLDDYVAFRIHGVTPRFVEELAELGYRDLEGDDLVAFRIHGVTPEFIREMEEEEGGRLSADDLVSMRIHGRWRR
jgi:hypothetical protein